MQLSVIIVNYNVKYFLEQCLLSVIKAAKNLDIQIIVVDNDSSDGSFDFFQNKFPEVYFIWNKFNAGYSKANNQALELAKGEYILFLNPDTILPEDCLEKCISFIKSEKDNIALGVRMIDGNGSFLKESKRAFPSPLTSFYKLSGLSKIFPHSKIFSRYHLGNLDENKNHEIDVLAGAFMMIPEKILEATSGFDEEFFMYGEDIDLSYRIQKKGFRNYYFAETTILHFKGESTRKGSLNYVRMFYTAMSVFVKKHYGRKQAGLYSFVIHIAIFFRAAMAALSRMLKSIWKKENIIFDEGNQTPISVAGNENEFDCVKEVLENLGKKNLVNIKFPEDIDEIRRVVDSGSINEIILCEGQISFKKIIELMQSAHSKINFKIYSAGSHGIIGSK